MVGVIYVEEKKLAVKEDVWPQLSVGALELYESFRKATLRSTEFVPYTHFYRSLHDLFSPQDIYAAWVSVYSELVARN